MDPYNKTSGLYTSSILLKLYNLIYHHFENQEAENDFIEFIRKFDEQFIEFKDRFVEENATAPKHPLRIKRDAEYDKKRRMMIISSLMNEGIEPDTNLSTEELRAMLNNVIAEKEKGSNRISEEVEASQNETEDIVESDDEVTIPKQQPDEVNKNDRIYEGTSIPENLQSDVEIVDDIESESYLEDNQSGDIDESNFVEDDISEVIDDENESDIVDIETMMSNEEIDVYVDEYGCYYVKDHNGYAYCDSDNKVIEEDISEETILRLISSGSLTKKTIKV